VIAWKQTKKKQVPAFLSFKTLRQNSSTKPQQASKQASKQANRQTDSQIGENEDENEHENEKSVNARRDAHYKLLLWKAGATAAAATTLEGGMG
jgi:hypothetical protein